MRSRSRFYAVFFIAPALIVYTVFMVYPLIDSLRLSLFDQSRTQPTFVGLQNFQTLLTSELWAGRFWNALSNNIIFFSIHLFVQNPVALFLASLLTVRRLRGRAIYRTLIFAPTTLSVVVVGFVWSLILNPTWGIFDGLLRSVGLNSLIQPWLGSEQTSLVVVSLMSVWQWIGVPLILFSAALVGIPEEIIEAATVDGASALDVFLRVRLPLILPTIGIVGVLTFVGNFNAFDLIYTAQGALGNPNYHTDILGTLFYRTFFGFQLQSGNATMGTTIAAMMFLIILGGVLLYLVGWQRRVVQVEY